MIKTYYFKSFFWNFISISANFSENRCANR